jgi:guanylate kinase
MSNLIIAGVSGVGKSFLESVLSKEYGYTSVTKYSNRPMRPNEKGLISLSDKDFDAMQNEFLSVIHQGGYKYGYKKAEIENHDKKTIATPMKDIEAHIKATQTPLIPIILGIKVKSLDLLRDRMKQRENFDSLPQDQQQFIYNKIEERMKLAQEDIGFMKHYEDMAFKYDGKVFYIEDDNTLFDEVIPYIAKM